MEKCPFVFSCKDPEVISEPAVNLSKDFSSIRPRIEELVSKFSVRDLVEEFICLGIRPLSSGWTLTLGEVPQDSRSELPPFNIPADTKIVKDLDGPCRKFIGPYTKKEHTKYLELQQDSDDEDDKILSYELPAVDKMVEVETGNTSVANSPPIVVDNLFVPSDVLASMANEVEKDVNVDSVDVDMSLASPVRVENVLEVANLNAQPEKNLADDRENLLVLIRKKEHTKYLELQQGKKQNWVLSALDRGILVRVHPDLKKKKKSVPKNIPKEASSSSSENGENSLDGESDSSGKCSDDSDSSESSEHAHSAPSVQETSSRELKRKKILSNSPVYSSLKKVRIAIDSDDEDDNILSYELPAVDKMVEVETGNTSVANSSPIVVDNLFVPSDVLASMANEVEKDVHVDSVDVDMSLASPVRVENVLEVANLNAQPEKNLADDRGLEPFIMTPSPELIKDVFGGFSERCSKNDGNHSSTSARSCSKGSSRDLRSKEKKSLERIAKLEGDRTKLCRDIDRLREENKFSSECIRQLRAEKAEAFDEDGELSVLNSWMSNAAASLSSCMLQFASRCSRVACETLCATLYSSGCSHLANLSTVVPNLLLSEANLNRTREIVRSAAKAFQLLFWKNRGYEDTISSLAASLADSNTQGGQSSLSRQGNDSTTPQVASKRKSVIHRVGPSENKNLKHIAFRAPTKSSPRVFYQSEDKIYYDDTCVFAFKFFSWQKRHRDGSLRDFALEFRNRRLKNNLNSTEFWNNFQPTERQLRIRKRRYSVVPYIGEPTPLQVILPSE
uniref:Uncharacterized protein n=1 Tax=Oryza meridionalis TaxID=40149 RepID=A0A0E0F955_9ORYZ